jgi:hypothetical protein
MPIDTFDKNGITMHATEIMPTEFQKPKTRKLYTFPTLKTGISYFGYVNIDGYTTRSGEKYAICISFFELYQDRIYDLLDDQQSFIQKRKHLILKRDVASGRRFVSGLRKIYADTGEVSPNHTPTYLLGSILDP